MVLITKERIENMAIMFLVALFFSAYAGSCIADGIDSYGDTWINYNISTSHPASIVIDGKTVNTTGNYYIATGLSPGTYHKATISGVDYEQTTGDYNQLYILWIMVILGYLLILLVLYIPLTYVVTLAYDTFLLTYYIPNAFYPLDKNILYLAVVLLFAFHAMALGRLLTHGGNLK